MKDKCKKCNNPNSFIVNKKHYLCDNCNCIRLHGKTRFELEKDKNTKRSEKINQTTKKKITKTTTQKRIREKEVKEKLKILKSKIHLENQQWMTYHCVGCLANGYTTHLDCSHILSIGQRKDLELLKDNIQLLCRLCHTKWESSSIPKMTDLLCFESNLSFIKKHDNYRYNRLLILLESHKS